MMMNAVEPNKGGHSGQKRPLPVKASEPSVPVLLRAPRATVQYSQCPSPIGDNASIMDKELLYLQAVKTNIKLLF
jgi:hypothetical protein